MSGAQGEGHRGSRHEVQRFLESSRTSVVRLTEHIERVRGHLLRSQGSAVVPFRQLEGVHVIEEPASLSERPDPGHDEAEPIADESEGIRIATRQMIDAVVGETLSASARAQLCSARDQLEHACRLLAREHAKFRDALESQATATVVTDSVTEVSDANAAAGAMLGMYRELLPGRLLAGFIDRPEADAFRDFMGPLWRSLGTETRSIRTRIRPRCGPVVAAILSVRMIHGDRRMPIGLHWRIAPATSE
jgi:PAS domain S-box-containing protein